MTRAQMRMTRIDDTPDLSLTPLSSISTVLASSWTVRFTLQTYSEDKWLGHHHDTRKCTARFTTLGWQALMYLTASYSTVLLGPVQYLTAR